MGFVVARASGKVLVTGGYLVLERQHAGVVFATDARFQTTVCAARGKDKVLEVSSPQFGWTRAYRVKVVDSAAVVVELEAANEGAANPYVETTLKNVIALALAKDRAKAEAALAAGLAIEILGANDFYSQRDEVARRGLPLTYDSLKSLPKFCVSPAASPASIRKTGLGSSAALITSLTGALMVVLGTVSADCSGPGNLAFVHNVAQFCHCLAQGKIGSGFDVSSAVYGSHKYRRFSPSVIAHLLALGGKSHSVNGQVLLSSLSPANTAWDAEVCKLPALPSSVSLVLGDIAAGSSTPSMVSKVNTWRERQSDEANRLWMSLDQANEEMELLLRSLCAQGDCTSDLASSIHATSTNIRGLMRTMGELTGAPIEPPEQTRLLDAMMQIPGVIAAGVPGAGGFDAVYALVASPTARDQLLEMWSSWAEMSVCPLLSSESSQGLVIERVT